MSDQNSAISTASESRVGSLTRQFSAQLHIRALDTSSTFQPSMIHGMMAPNKMIPCKFFAQGSCRNEGSCNFIHEGIISSHQAPSDSRAKVPCKFLSRPGGCQKGSCPYLHAADGPKMDMSTNQDFKINKEKANNSSFHSS